MEKVLTTKEIANYFKVAERVARRWCVDGRFPNARKQQTPRGDYWVIPEGDIKTFEPPTRGRKLSENPSKATLAKRRQREQDKDLHKWLK